jgi:DNA-directed RNA polymerase II subunit RPB1
MNFTKRVESIDFALVNPEELKKYSVVEITSSDLYDNNEPRFGGLFDLRMGPCEKNYLCKTCKKDSKECVGHFGHIELAKPVYMIHFLNNVKKVLGCVCNVCSSLLIDTRDNTLVKSILKKKKSKRLAFISKQVTRGAECLNCCRKQPKYSKENMHIYITYPEEKKTILPAEQTFNIFSNISVNDVELMGLSNTESRPEWMICTVLPVIPPCIRPSVKHSTNLRSEDDLTYKLLDIVKSNNNLLAKIKNNQLSHIDEYIEYLQYNVTTLIDNEVKGIPSSRQRSGRLLKSIKQRIKGKEGRIRGNLTGKRVDYSARSVVSPDPNLDIDQLGVPYDICKKLTFPEIVNDYNYDKLVDLVKNGADKYPGANFVYKTKNGKEQRFDLRFVKNIKLENGDRVERHLLKDDVTLFNRQPSLNHY